MDPIQEAQQGELIFRTEEDRLKAISDLPEVPPEGVDRDTFIREQDELQEKIQAAQIDPNYQKPGDAPKPDVPTSGVPSAGSGSSAPSDQGGDWYKPVDWTFSMSDGKQFTIGKEEITDEMRAAKVSNAKDLLLDYVSTKRYNSTKQREYDSATVALQSKVDDLTVKVEDTQKLLDEAKKGFKKEGITEQQQQKADIPTQVEIDKAESELTEIQGKLEKMDDDDMDAVPLNKKATLLNIKLRGMEKRIYNSKFVSFEEERKKREGVDAQRLLDDKNREEGNRQIEAKKKVKTDMKNAINGFGETIPELKMSKDFTEVEKEYAAWATDIAASYFNISEKQVTSEQAEMAVNSFLNRTPIFIEKLTKDGKLNRFPPDLRKYLINTELYFMTKGMELDTSSGKWTQNEWSLPDMDTAYERWKRKKGLKHKELIEAANKAEEELLKAMNPTGIAEQPAPKDGAQQSREPGKMTKEEAETVHSKLEKEARDNGVLDVDEWIGNLERKNPTDERILLYQRAVDSLFPEPEAATWTR